MQDEKIESREEIVGKIESSRIDALAKSRHSGKTRVRRILNNPKSGSKPDWISAFPGMTVKFC